MIALWRVKGRLPLSIDSTAQLLELKLRDGIDTGNRIVYHSENELKLLYAAVVVRSVNGLVDPSQQGIYATSVLTLAEKMGLPGWIVELRHDATHNQMPSLSVLRTAANTLTNWYFDFYWQPQMSLLQSLTTSCLPVVPTPITITTSKTKVAVQPVALEQPESTQQQDSSPTFVTEIFMPIFIGGVVQSAPEVKNTDSTSTLVAEEAGRQRKFWSSRVRDILRVNNNAVFSFLHGLLGAARDTLERSHRHDLETWRAEWELEMVLCWVTEVTSTLPIRSGGSGATTITTTAGPSTHLHVGFMQASLGALQKLSMDAKNSLASKVGEIIKVINAYFGTDLLAVSKPVASSANKKETRTYDKKRKIDAAAAAVSQTAEKSRKSTGGASFDSSGTSSINTVTTAESCIRRELDCPLWPLGCVPGDVTANMLYMVVEVPV